MSLFGWCAGAGQHDKCPVQFEHWMEKTKMIICSCECHVKDKLEE